jgi:hypothetical protein
VRARAHCFEHGGDPRRRERGRQHRVLRSPNIRQGHQIKRFLDTVKSAPLEVRELLEEIEILNETLLDLEGQNSQFVDDRIIRRCESHCRRAAQLIAELLNELQAKIGKRKTRGSIAFALKKGDIDQIFGRLEIIKSTLGLAILRIQMYDAILCCV